MRLIDADACPALFDAEFQETKRLILAGEKHLDNLAEGFMEANNVIRSMPTIAQPPNDPLTLEELREMDGEPVFIKCLFNDELSSYVVVDKRRDSAGIFTRLFYASFDYYGGEWLAYRRKPEEG